MGLIASVAIDGAIGSFDKLYSYKVPDYMAVSAKEGCRVTVPFGNGNKKRQGMIFGLKAEDAGKLKEIIGITDDQPVLSDEMLKICEYLREHTFCSYFDAVHSVLPVGLNYRLKDFYLVNPDFSNFSLLDENEKELFEFTKKNGETSFEKIAKHFGDAEEILLSLTEKQALLHNTQPIRNMQDMKRRYVRITDDGKTHAALTSRQKEVFEALFSIGSCSVKELQYFTGATVGVINALCEKGYAELYEKQEFRMPYTARKNPVKKEIILTESQQKAFDGLKEDSTSGASVTSLLYGVTGSGKTQVFLKLADEFCESDSGVIIMVPEIALTPQMIKIFTDRYGDKVAVLHSGLSVGQRMDEYNRIRLGRAKIAIGTRSAVFAPFKKLGLIIMDEEQEHTYKSEKSPRFHARDVAKLRSMYHKCLLCLSSATPSLESFSRAVSGKYKLYTLPERYGNAVLPAVLTVDMKNEVMEGNSSDISRLLAEKIQNRLDNKKQVIILLNRRGHNTYVSCRECGHVFECDECSISLTYHKANNRLMCHYCGKSLPVPDECPECKSHNIRFSGSGTQHLEEQIKLLFPSARVLRLDADSTITRDSYSVNLTAFANGEYDILIGTQMVAKGLDFPNVTLVGIIGADKAQNSDDYRSFERSFSLLTQVIGRAGRAGDAGIAVVQTSDPSSHMITLAGKQDYDSFYKEEIESRRMMIYPPFCDVCVVFTQSMDNGIAKAAIKEIFENIKELLGNEHSDIKAIILGPSAASVPKVGGRYRYRMIIKCKNNRSFRDMIRTAVDIKKRSDLSIGIDMNPENII